MAAPKGISAEEIVQALEETGGNQSAAGRLLGITRRSVRQRITGRQHSNGSNSCRPIAETIAGLAHPHRIEIDLQDGVALVGSDAHIWPGVPTTAMRAFSKMIVDLDPAVVVLNGDVFDGARMSRFPSIGWEHKPKIIEELGACQQYLRSLMRQRRRRQRDRRWIWTLGNHDLRFETKIADALQDLEGVQGVHLKDHFPDWEPCWSVWLNPGPMPVTVKHRFKGGIHARHNNTLYAGVSIICGHLHSLGVTPFSDYHGARFGVDTGTLASPYGPQFINYTEDNPVNWRSGFIVLTFRSGRLLWPEIVHVLDEDKGLVEFRGSVIQV